MNKHGPKKLAKLAPKPLNTTLGSTQLDTVSLSPNSLDSTSPSVSPCNVQTAVTQTSSTNTNTDTPSVNDEVKTSTTNNDSTPLSNPPADSTTATIIESEKLSETVQTESTHERSVSPKNMVLETTEPATESNTQCANVEQACDVDSNVEMTQADAEIQAPNPDPIQNEAPTEIPPQISESVDETKNSSEILTETMETKSKEPITEQSVVAESMIIEPIVIEPVTIEPATTEVTPEAAKNDKEAESMIIDEQTNIHKSNESETSETTICDGVKSSDPPADETKANDKNAEALVTESIDVTEKDNSMEVQSNEVYI